MANNNWVCRLAEGETVQRDGKDRVWQIVANNYRMWVPQKRN